MSVNTMDAPRVYVLILNWHGADDTIECLDSVFDLDYPNFRVVVCDNGSTDGSLDRIRRWAAGDSSFVRPPGSPLRGGHGTGREIDVVELDRAAAERGEGGSALLTLIQTGENLGFAGGNNVGLRFVLAQADADYVWLLNNDTVAAPDALRSLVESLEASPSLGAVGSKLLLYYQPETLQAAAGGHIVPWRGIAKIRGEFEPDDGRWDQPARLDCIIGASFCLRAETIEATGLLDERYFMYSEEMDLCVRIRKAGWELGYVPDSKVWHKVNRSVGGASPMRDYYAVRSTLLWVRRFHPRLLPFTLAYALYRFLLPKLVRGEFARVSAVLRAHRDFFLGRLDHSYR